MARPTQLNMTRAVLLVLKTGESADHIVNLSSQTIIKVTPLINYALTCTSTNHVSISKLTTTMCMLSCMMNVDMSVLLHVQAMESQD